MYALLRGGRFGNTLRSWPTYEAMMDSGFRGRIGLRYTGRGGSPFTAYDLAQTAAYYLVHDLWVLRLGADLTKIQWCEAAPDQHIVLQGEICECPHVGGYALHYSTHKAQMRVALKEAPRNHTGPGALLILKQVMDPGSYEDLQALLDDFPEAVIEFSVYRINLGAVPGRNTIFWEVRNY
jgi:hypothetical protein